MIRNIGISTLTNLSRVGIQFVLNIVLARFLSPHDFGLVALVLPVTLLILLIGDFGLTAAIVRSEQLKPSDLGACALFCFFAGLGALALTTILFATGVFDELPKPLPTLAVAFAFVVLLALVALVPRAALERRLSYGTISTVEFVANCTAFIAAFAAAFGGAGVWSFAIYYTVMQAIRSLGFWMLAHRHVKPTTAWRRALPLARFGGWVVAFNFVNYMMRNADNFIVGGILGANALGIYAMSYQIMLVPLMTFTWPISGVLLATLSRLCNEPERFRSAYLAVIGLTAIATLPLMTFVVLRVPLLFDLLLPPRWHEVGQSSKHLAVAGGLQSITSFVGVIFVAKGKVRAQLFLGLAITLVTLGAITVAAVVGRDLIYVIDTYVLLTIIASFIYLVAMARLLEVRPQVILAALGPAFAACGTGSGLMLLLLHFIPHVKGGVGEAMLSVVGFGIGTLLLTASQHQRIRDTLLILKRAAREGERATAGISM